LKSIKREHVLKKALRGSGVKFQQKKNKNAGTDEILESLRRPIDLTTKKKFVIFLLITLVFTLLF